MNNIKKIILALSIITAGSINLLVAGKAQLKREGSQCANDKDCFSNYCPKGLCKSATCIHNNSCFGGYHCNHNSNYCTKNFNDGDSCTNNSDCKSYKCQKKDSHSSHCVAK